MPLSERTESPSIAGMLINMVFGSNPSTSLTNQLSRERLSPKLLDLAEQLSQAQSGLAEAHEHLNETHHRENRLERELQMTYEDAKNMQSQIYQMSDELDTAHSRIQEFDTYKIRSEQERDEFRYKWDNIQRELHVTKDEVERLQQQQASHNDDTERTRLITMLNDATSSNRTLEDRVKTLTQERGEANAALKRLRGANNTKAPSSETFSLDSFRDTVDQVSEAHVKSSGHPSVERLNDAIDSLVLDVLEQAAEVVAAQGDGNPAPMVETRPSDSVLLSALTKPGLTEECRGLLLDSALHSIVLPCLYRVFFQGEVVTHLADSTKPLDDVFKQISETGMPPPAIPISTLNLSRRAVDCLATLEGTSREWYITHVGLFAN